MLWLTLLVVCPLLLLLYVIWKNVADADLTLLWNEQFGQKPEVLKGQVAWVTGASSGIGKHLAYQLARVGCRLVLSARSTDELEKVRKDCLGYGKLEQSDVLVLTLDMTDIAAHAAATDTVMKHFGQIDVLVNNAGRTQRAFVIDSPLEIDRELIEVNVMGPVSLTKCVLPHMLARRHGYILVTGSITGKLPLPFSATYCLTKYAVIGYYHSLAAEVFQQNIYVTVALPGPVKSNVLAVAFTDKVGELYGGKHPDDSASLMQTSRCAQLMLIGAVNKLSEVWISRNPFLLYVYYAQYFPVYFLRSMVKVGVEKFTAMRSGSS